MVGALRHVPIAVVLALLVAALGGSGGGSAGPTLTKDVIVVLKDGVEPVAVARDAGITPRRVYRDALRGFAARLPVAAIKALRRHRQVRLIAEDRPMYAHAQTLPTGIDRISADLYPGVAPDSVDQRGDVDVAVLDSGIDVDHPDLNVGGGENCSDGASYDDGSGHGTHVAGTIGALDNGIGAVGVAPGARLWAINVIGPDNDVPWSDVICGLDWVSANRGTIEVINMSLGGVGSDSACSSGPLHQAICNVVAAGIPIIVSAGNEGKDASRTIPAAYEEVITVSAMADFDGRAGGKSPTTCGAPERDDTFASFSNYGADVDIAAPGRCIYSTIRRGRYASWSGTSMAAPHVTGAIALYLAATPGASPAQVRSWLLNSASTPQGADFDFTGERDGHAERMLAVGSAARSP